MNKSKVRITRATINCLKSRSCLKSHSWFSVVKIQRMNTSFNIIGLDSLEIIDGVITDMPS